MSTFWTDLNSLDDAVSANAAALDKLFTSGRLDEDIAWTIALAAAAATRSPRVISLVGDAHDCLHGEGETVRKEALEAASWMSFTNTFFRYSEGVHGEPDYEKFLPVFKRKGRRREGRDLLLHELACLAIAAINGCMLCTKVHRNYAIKAGADEQMCQDAVEIGAHMNVLAVSQYLTANS